MSIYRCKLPHFEKDGASCFIMFHTGDFTLNDDTKLFLIRDDETDAPQWA
ncbi:MAG TPA: hypothetical protein VE783_02115 [Candidatus Limnocylindrales bacterium]|jgi:hypothetical protein|nr:hypothetical protein [Candidatus Limnocylindrales bacterium]